MLSPLTQRQKEILEYINLYISIHKISPSLEEIKDHFGLKAISTIHEHIEKLKKKGYLKKEMNQARGIVTNNIEDKDLIEIDILGEIAAGEPIEAIENPEPIVISKEILGRKSGDFYCLRVKGDSMIEDGIHSGDLVIIKSQKSANNGDTIVAIVDDNHATLKRFYKQMNKIKLQPANEKLKPKFYKSIDIRGKVIALIRNF